MAFSLKNFLEESAAQIVPGDKKTAATVRAARAAKPAPATLPKKGYKGNPDNQPGFQWNNNSLTRGFSRTVDQINPGDNNRTWKQRTPTNKMDAGQQFRDNAIVKGIVDPIQKSANTVGAGTMGLGGLMHAGYESAFGTDESYQRSLNDTSRLMDDMLRSGLGGKGGYLTPEQAASTGGGWQGYKDNFLKPTATAAAEVAPLVTPIKAPALGSSLITKAASVGAQNAGIGAAASATTQLVNTGKVDPTALARDTAIAGGFGAAFPVAGAAGRAGAHTVTTKLVPEAKRVASAANEKLMAPQQYRLTPDERATMSDFSDMMSGDYVPDIPTINALHAAARDIAAKNGVDITSGGRRDVSLRVGQFLEDFEMRRQRAMQGGYLGEDPVMKPIRKSNEEAIAKADKAMGRNNKIMEEVDNGIEIAKPFKPSVKTPEKPPAKPPVESVVDEAAPAGKKSRFANKTVQQSDEVSPELKQLVKDEKVTYDPATNAGRASEAQKFLKGKSKDKAFNEVMRNLEDTSPAAKGQHEFNAIELAKRLDSSAKQDDLFKATEIYHRLSERATKKGQEIQALTYLNNRTPQGLQYGAIRDLKKAGIEITAERQNAIKQLRQKIEKTKPGTDERNLAVYEMAKYVNNQVPTGKGKKLINIWRAGLLTSPTTTAGNILGNSGEAAVRKGFVNPLATAIDYGFSKFTGKRTMAMDGGFGSGVKEGAGKLGQFVKTGYDERNALSKYDTHEINYGNDGVGKLLGGYVNGTYRLMSLADQPFWYGARGESLAGQAKAAAINQGLKGDAQKQFIREFMDNPPKEAMEIATKDARYSTFQNETKLGQVAAKGKKPAGAVGDFFVPFTQVPAAIATRIVQRTPVGTATEAVKQFINIRNGGKFDQRAMSKAMAEGAFGPAVMGAGYALANSGLMTFGFPEDRKERDLWEAEGKQPYSVKVGDRWYSLNYLQPFGTLLAIGGQANQSVKDGEDAGAVISQGIATAGQSVMNQSFLKGVSGVLDAIDDPKRYAENYVSNTAGSVVPNFVRAGARASDDKQRETGGAIEGIKGAIPGARQTLPAKQDMFGNDVPAKDNFLNQFVNPFRPSKDRSGDPTVQELRRLLEVDEGVAPTAAKKNSISGVELTDDQVHGLNAFVGPKLKEAYKTTMADDRYKSLSDEDKAKALKNVNSTVFGALKAQYAVDNKIATADNFDLNTKQKRFLGGGTLDALTKETDKTYSEKYDDAYEDYQKNADSWSPVEREKKENSLRYLTVQKDYDNDTVSLYGMSKERAYNLLSSNPDGKKMAQQMLAYGDALVDAGLIDKNKFRDKYGRETIKPKAKSSGGGGGGRSRSGLSTARGAYDLYGGTEASALSTEKSLRELVQEARMSSKKKALA